MALRDVKSVVWAAQLPLRLLVSGCCIVAALTHSMTAIASPLEVARQKLEQAERDLQAAVTAEEAAYRERDAFLSQHFERLRENATPVADTRQSAPLPTVNPRWQELDAKLGQLSARRQE